MKIHTRIQDDKKELIVQQFKVLSCFSFSLTVQIVILGDGGTGKTSIVQRFAKGNFQDSYMPTIGLEWYSKEVRIENNLLKLQIWDIGGQQLNSKLLPKYIFGAHAIIYVFDITSYDTFKNLSEWSKMVKRVFGVHRFPLICVFPNKIDLEHQRMIRESVHENWAIENNYLEYQVSARSGDGVNVAFLNICSRLAKVPIPMNMLENAQFIKACVVNHPNVMKVSAKKVKEVPKKRKKKLCKIQ